MDSLSRVLTTVMDVLFFFVSIYLSFFSSSSSFPFIPVVLLSVFILFGVIISFLCISLISFSFFFPFSLFYLLRVYVMYLFRDQLIS